MTADWEASELSANAAAAALRQIKGLDFIVVLHFGWIDQVFSFLTLNLRKITQSDVLNSFGRLPRRGASNAVTVVDASLGRGPSRSTSCRSLNCLQRFCQLLVQFTLLVCAELLWLEHDREL